MSALEPEPLTGSVRFSCRCGFVIDSEDFTPRKSQLQPDAYAVAREEHAKACPMRFDPPWPFDRLPMITRTLLGARPGPGLPGSDGGEAVASGEPDPCADRARNATHDAATSGAPSLAIFERPRRSARVLLRGLLGPPAWVRRRAAFTT